MIKVVRTNSEHPDFVELVRQLDAYLAEIDGEEHAFYGPLNKIDKIRQVIIAQENDQAVGCGAIREYAPDVMEVKRMYTVPGNRKKGIATTILTELEKWAAELSYRKCILETGKNQPHAIELYKKSGYRLIPNYGNYAGVSNSVCFEKDLELKKI